MVSSNGDRELAFTGMCAYHPRDGFRGAGYDTWVLKFADKRDALSGDLLELEVSIEDDVPIKVFEFFDEFRIHDMNGTLIDTGLSLGK